MVGITGGLGSGKTAIAVNFIVDDYNNGFKVYSNTPLKKIEYELLTIEKIEEMLNNETQLNNVILFIDELPVWVDCRRSSSYENLIISYLILQSRKRGCHVYYTAQDFDLGDVRVYDYTTLKVSMEKITYVDDSGAVVEIEDIREMTILDGRTKPSSISNDFVDISTAYDYYDTDFIIMPLAIKKKQKKKKIS